MKRVFKTVVITLAVLVATNCGPPQPTSEESAYTGCYPFELNAEPYDGGMAVTWRSHCDRNIAGYNIYISEDPIVANHPGRELPSLIEPFNHTVFAGDTDPSDSVEHYDAAGLDNGVPYFVSVRIVYPDRSLSKPTREKRIVCGPRGEIDLAIRYAGGQDGFSFEANDYVSADDVGNDLYFFSKDGHDYLASPSHLDAFLSYSKLKVVATSGTLAEIAERLPLLSSLPVDDRVEVQVGNWIWLITDQGNNTLIQVRGLSGSGTERRINLFYFFTPAGHLPTL